MSAGGKLLRDERARHKAPRRARTVVAVKGGMGILSTGLLLLFVGSGAGPALAQSFAVAPDLWDRPRSAQAVLAAPGVRQAVDIAVALPAAQLVIHHTAGQEGQLQAEELKAWLMALAIDGRRITLVADQKPRENLALEVRK
jgi:hypothetical protein